MMSADPVSHAGGAHLVDWSPPIAAARATARMAIWIPLRLITHPLLSMAVDPMLG
jgi:hypothetical protein